MHLVIFYLRVVAKKNKNMIAEDYVSFEIAKLLKEKGFNENTNNQYLVCGIHYGELGEYNITDRSRNPENYIPAPTIQMAMKWLREVYNVFITISCELFPVSRKVKWLAVVETMDNCFCNEDECDEYDTYEEAAEDAIMYIAENLI